MKKIIAFVLVGLFVCANFAQAGRYYNYREPRVIHEKRVIHVYPKRHYKRYRNDVNWETLGYVALGTLGVVALFRALSPKREIVYVQTPQQTYPQYQPLPRHQMEGRGQYGNMYPQYPPPPQQFMSNPPRTYSQPRITQNPVEQRVQMWEEAHRKYDICLSEREVDLSFGAPPEKAKRCDRLDPLKKNWTR